MSVEFIYSHFYIIQIVDNLVNNLYYIKMRMNIRQSIEYFHLLYTQLLSRKLKANNFALKGGCNLRFFMGSLRYSEDIDFDVQIISVSTLKKNIEKLFKDSLLTSQLHAKNLEIVSFNNPKNTETTQRWKLILGNKKTHEQLNTKIEFSRRNGIDDGFRVDVPTSEVLNLYGLPKFPIPHYDKDRAFAQKIGALIGRTEPQERDAFDLDVLLNFGAKFPKGEKITDDEVDNASEIIMEMDFDRYMSKVIAYLPEEYRQIYGTQVFWNDLQERILQVIREVSK